MGAGEKKIMIGIITDSILANIPLMKISSYYDSAVEWYMPLMHNEFKKIYYSKIFKFTKKVDREDEMIVGGTGCDLSIKLPDDIERQDLDYSIYPECDYSLQYFSRGCIRKCDFCLVPEKEGKIHTVRPMNLNKRGKYIKVLDNNFFGSPGWREAIEYLISNKQPVSIDGIDIRIFKPEHGEALKKIKLHKFIYIAWDNVKDNVLPKIKLMTEYIKPYRITVYVLIGFNSTPEEDYYRVMKIRETGCNPFVMPFNKRENYQKRFARWVNHKAVFKSVRWEDYV